MNDIKINVFVMILPCIQDTQFETLTYLLAAITDVSSDLSLND